jgi:hypothetical protein
MPNIGISKNDYLIYKKGDRYILRFAHNKRAIYFLWASKTIYSEDLYDYITRLFNDKNAVRKIDHIEAPEQRITDTVAIFTEFFKDYYAGVKDLPIAYYPFNKACNVLKLKAIKRNENYFGELIA